MADEELSFWHKLKEFVVEIGIIVFAVSLSIWFHGLSEHRHQQKDVKSFLLGLRSDLVNDSLSMSADKASFLRYAAAYSYISKAKVNEALSADTLLMHKDGILGISFLAMHDGRFEGFKLSGKLGTIEEEKLQNDIVDLYQDDVSNLKVNIDLYNVRKQRLFDYVIKNIVRTSDSTSNISEVFKKEECRNICWSLSNVDQITQRYDACQTRMRAIITEIDKEYGAGK
jgi:hypothetical protein